MATPALPANGCIGILDSGAKDYQFRCLKQLDDDGNPVYTCTKRRFFYVNCPKINRQCNRLSGAYVSAVTVCNQRFYN